MNTNVTILSSERNGGKTSSLVQLAQQLSCDETVDIGGVITTSNTDKTSYYLQFIHEPEQYLLLTETPQHGWEPFGRFFYDPSVFLLAEQAILARLERYTHVVIDEVGMMELKGLGHARLLKELMTKPIELIITVRTPFVKNITEAFNMRNYHIIPVGEYHE